MRMIIDTDAGVDDAQAIMLALAQPGVTVEAITTVTGNVHLDKVVPNVLTTLAIMQQRVPVYRGAAFPLVPGFWHPEERVHGADGLGGYPDRPPFLQDTESEPAPQALVRLANENPGELTLVTLGPLTNVALACRLDPTFPFKIKQLIFMGGTVSAMGNARSITAEFNFYCDPEAARVTLDAFPQATMVGWEATLAHPFTWDQYDALAVIDTTRGHFLRDTTLATVMFLRQLNRVLGYLLPDPLAMAVALQPDLILASDHHYMTVELEGRHTRGQGVVDYFGLLGYDPNVQVVTQIDIDGVYAMFEQTLR